MEQLRSDPGRVARRIIARHWGAKAQPALSIAMVANVRTICGIDIEDHDILGALCTVAGVEKPPQGDFAAAWAIRPVGEGLCPVCGRWTYEVGEDINGRVVLGCFDSTARDRWEAIP